MIVKRDDKLRLIESFYKYNRKEYEYKFQSYFITNYGLQ